MAMATNKAIFREKYITTAAVAFLIFNLSKRACLPSAAATLEATELWLVMAEASSAPRSVGAAEAADCMEVSTQRSEVTTSWSPDTLFLFLLAACFSLPRSSSDSSEKNILEKSLSLHFNLSLEISNFFFFSFLKKAKINEMK